MIFIFLINVFALDGYQTLMNKQAYLQCKVSKLKTIENLTLTKVKEMKTACLNEANVVEKNWESQIIESDCEWKPCQKHSLKSDDEFCLGDWIKSTKKQNLKDCLLTTVHDACQDSFSDLGGKTPRKIYWRQSNYNGYWFCSPKLK